MKNATFDRSSGLWTVMVENSDAAYKGRVLVCADGAPSKMATYLGLVSQPPQGSCSRSYIESGTHMFKADGVVFYNKGLLPGTSMHVHICTVFGKRMCFCIHYTRYICYNLIIDNFLQGRCHSNNQFNMRVVDCPNLQSV